MVNYCFGGGWPPEMKKTFEKDILKQKCLLLLPFFLKNLLRFCTTLANMLAVSVCSVIMIKT